MKTYNGLTETEAEKRLKRDGENKLSENKKSSALKIFAGQFKDIMVIVLLTATVVSTVMGELWDALIIIIIVVLNAILGFIQEYRTEKTLEALKKIAAPTAQVFRGGILKNVPAEKLVRGDIINLEAGGRIPADCKVLESMAFECDEAVLTGESIPVKKYFGENSGNNLNQATVCYMGTIAIKGHAAAEIIETGKSTQMGMVSDMLTDIKEEETPLQKRLGELGKIIGFACIGICIVVSLAGILRGYAFFDMLLTGISLAVAAIPEGLPATVTISLALAVRRIYKQKALVNKLHSVETLGCANVICTDKTGTLTQNKMTVTDIFADNKHYNISGENKKNYGTKSKTLELLYTCGAVCNNSIKQTDGSFSGDPTETALHISAVKAGITNLNYMRLSEIPFESTTRFMEVTVSDNTGKRISFIKGALDVILDKCGTIMLDGKTCALIFPQKKNIISAGDEMSARALRLLGFAYKSENEDKYVFLGIQGMSDPLRPEVKSAVKKCEKAGVRVVMLTGDHKNTANEIARQAGILKNDMKIFTGSDIASMSDSRLSEEVKCAAVFARVSPADKLRIVRALKRNGEIIAMTGDGVNDAPAVKEASIGVAMGITGTDVTKEAAQLVLLDDNFATLVNAIEQGRTIYNNIRKFVRYMLSCNIGEVVTMLLAMLLGMPVVLVPIQILLINLITDGLPAIALGMEPPTEKIMEEPPRKASDSIFSGGMVSGIIFKGISIGLFTLLTFVTVFNSAGLPAARTAAMSALALSQLIHVFECKDHSRGIFNAKYLNNFKLIGAVTVSFAIIMFLMLTNVLSPVFQTVPLDIKSIMTVILYASGLSFVKGIVKLVK